VRVIEELKRRKVVRVAVVYAATAFVVLQAADLLATGLSLPEWVFPVVTVLLVLGFPVALVLGWALELSPEGIRRTEAAPGMRGAAQHGAPASPSAKAVPSLLGRRTVITAGALVLVGVGLGAGWVLKPAGSAVATDGLPANATAVAVLPFMNLGAAEDEYFADGIADALRGKLAGIDGLVVIASASSRPYKGTGKTPQQIGRELGVAYLLAGTVRWARTADGESRVQVSPELVAAESGTTRWQQPFDAVISDVFTVQGEIAARVADALSVTLRERQRRELAAPPTDNMEAYDAFLRASALLEQAELGAPLRRAAADGFRRAVELDPAFALAWAQLGYAHVGAYWFGEDHTDARLRQARQATHRALQLQPDLLEAHIADGYHWYWGLRDYERALAALERARRIDGSHARVEAAIGNVLRRRGDFRQALEHKRRAVMLDPRNAMLQREVAHTAIATGDLEEADRASRRAIALAPEVIGNYLFRAHVLYARDDTTQAHATFREAVRVLGDERTVVEIVNRLWTTWLAFPDLATWRVLEHLSLGSEVVDSGAFRLLRAEWLRLDGQHARSVVLADSALPFLERAAGRSGDDWWYYGQLALGHALAGRPDAARAALAEAHERLGRAPDAWETPRLAHHAAKVAVVLGDREGALAALADALRPPTHVTPAFIAADLRFRDLVGDPRFGTLLARTALR
jgi:TolB-like protein/Tfp pilus assembly protein PilF